MSISFPSNPFIDLPLTTIVPDPEDKQLFIQWLTRLYEDLATVINLKDWTYYTIPVGSVASPIPNIPNMGAFLICIAGTMDGMPACTYSMLKTNSTAPGQTQLIQDQAGTMIGSDASWDGKKLQIVTNLTTTNFEIRHDATVPGLIGNFNVRFIGTM
jgi:starvation-inducible outer membrane lipoprotein